MPNSVYEIDLEQERIFVDQRWRGRVDLTGRLTQRLASMDYNVAHLSAAVEQLDHAIKSAETFSVRLPADVALQLKDTAGRQGVPVASVIRESVVSYRVGAALSKLA